MAPGVVISVALVACHRPPDARDRALALLPRAATLVGAADGGAIAAPAFRRVIDTVRPRLPASLGCVVDAALAAEAVGLAAGPTGATVVIIGSASGTCPALSRVAPDVWIATVGGATVAAGRDASVQVDPRWARALPYLRRAPVAVAAELGDRHVIAAASSDPLSAWVVIDGPAPPPVLARWPKLHVERRRDQTVVRGDALAVDDLVAIGGDLAKLLDSAPAGTRAPFGCPPIAVRCTGTHLVVTSVDAVLGGMTAAAREPVVEAGEIIGLRLAEPAGVGERGDVLLGIDAHRVATAEELATIAGRARRKATIAIRRGTTDYVIDVEE